MTDSTSNAAARTGGRQHPRVSISFPEQGRTIQSMKDECDINHIMNKWKTLGEFNHLAFGEARYGDFTNVDDYQTACNTIKAAEESFFGLPADIRDRVNNDPQELIAFLDDPANNEEAIEMGLLPKPEGPPPGRTPPPENPTPAEPENPPA